ncbi:MAG: hypothetical protein GXO79_07740 [Chlorobi bacterium]|nr:hypothetical protein [Chlorobiota bacterium]
MKRIAITLLLFVIFETCFSQIKSKNIDWNKDIEFLRVELPKNHKNFFFKKSEKSFNKGLDQIISQKDSLSDLEIILKLQQLIASFGDSHTRINWYPFLKKKDFLPIGLYWFSDGIYILKTSKEYEDLLGKKIVKVNGYSIKEITDSLKTLIAVDNKALVKQFIPNILQATKLLDYFGFSKKGVYELELEDDNRNTQIKQIKASVVDKQFVSFQTKKPIYSWQGKRISYSLKYFENEKILYVKYNNCSPTTKELQKDGTFITISFKDFQKQIFSILKQKEVDKFIIDMRFNGGGNSIYGTRLVKKLAKNKINSEGKLYVAIGRKTFSSAILNTLDFKENTKAIVVGENTGGKPNHYGEIRSFKLPNSGILIYYSTKYFKRVNVEMNTIQPDVEIEMSFKEYKQGTDPVFEWIMNN